MLGHFTVLMISSLADMPSNTGIKSTYAAGQQGSAPMGSRQSCAFWLSAILGFTPPSQAMGLVLIDSTPPASPMS